MVVCVVVVWLRNTDAQDRQAEASSLLVIYTNMREAVTMAVSSMMLYARLNRSRA